MKKQYRKTLRKIFFYGFIISLLAIVSGLVLAYIYEDKIKQFTITKINNSINAKIKVEQINLSFFSQFPFASLNFKNVLILSKDSTKTQSLIEAKDIYLSFDIFELINDDYSLQNIVIEDAVFNLVVSKDGIHNFDFFNTNSSDSSDFLLDLNSVYIINTQFNYHNIATNQSFNVLVEDATFNGQFSKNNFNIVLSGKNDLQSFVNQGRTIVKNKSIELNVQLIAEPTTGLYNLQKGKLIYQGIPLGLSGQLSFGKNTIGIDAHFKAQKLNVQKVLENLPSNNKELFEQYTMDGLVSIDASLKGNIGGKHTPHIELSANLYDFSIESKQYNFALNELSLKLDYNNGKRNSLKSSSITIQNFSTESSVGKLSGKILIQNLWQPQIKAEINSSLDLGKVKQHINIDTIGIMTGMADLQSWFNISLLHNDDSNKWELSHIAMDHNFDINNASFSFYNSNTIYESIYAKGRMEDNYLKINSIKLISQNTKLDGQLSLYNLPIPIFKRANNKYIIEGNINANELSYSQIAEALPLSNSNDSRFSNKIDIRLKLNIGHFVYKNLEATNARGDFAMVNRRISFQNLSFNSFNGSFSGNIWIDGSKQGGYELFNQANLSGVDISKTFIAFNNFDQNVIGSQNLKGKLFTDYGFKCSFDQEWNIINKSIELNADMEIRNGELNNVKSLNALKSYTKINDFSHIEFSTLRNSISIKDSKIIIPDMIVNSDKMSIQLSGTHDFDNVYEYHFIVLLSEVMGKNHNESLSNEFGEIEDDGFGRTRLYFTVKGKGDEFDVKYDRSGLSKKLKEDLKEEKSSLKNALNKEFGWFKSEEEEQKKDSIKAPKREKETEEELIKKQEEGEFIIDWDEEEG